MFKKKPTEDVEFLREQVEALTQLCYRWQARAFAAEADADRWKIETNKSTALVHQLRLSNTKIIDAMQYEAKKVPQIAGVLTFYMKRLKAGRG